METLKNTVTFAPKILATTTCLRRSSDQDVTAKEILIMQSLCNAQYVCVDF